MAKKRTKQEFLQWFDVSAVPAELRADAVEYIAKANEQYEKVKSLSDKHKEIAMLSLVRSRNTKLRHKYIRAMDEALESTLDQEHKTRAR